MSGFGYDVGLDAAGMPDLVERLASRRVPAGLARRAGALIERAWERDLFGLRSRGVGSDDGEPPLTEFLAEQLSTAHWFDQRRTREVLSWTPTVSIDEGLHRVAAYYRDR